MNKDFFELRKAQLIQAIHAQVEVGLLSETELADLTLLSKILNDYTYASRLLNKGTLSHVIIDSIQLDNDFLESFLWFDKSIK